MNPREDTSVATRLSAEQAFGVVSALEQEIGKVIVGQHELIRRLLTGLFAAIPFATSRGRARAGCGHILLEGVPGVAKTLTATTIAQAISARFQRIQLTPDLLPADILGTRIYDATTATFRIEQGPIFTNILLADEINRATPKTQSALLEAMQERQVTLSDTTLAAAHLVFSGVAERFPRIKWVLSHLGGAIPYLAERLDRGYEAFAECRRNIRQPPRRSSQGPSRGDSM